jgi:integrase
MSSYRDIDMLDPLFEALRKHRQEARGGTTYVFPGKTGKPLEVNNLRNRVWYPAIAAAGLRRRTMYQTRHTFASLMLSHGEDPLWVARMLGHTSLDMIFKHYGKFIRNRSRKDGGRFLEGLKEAEACPPLGRTEAAPVGYSNSIDHEPGGDRWPCIRPSR